MNLAVAFLFVVMSGAEVTLDQITALAKVYLRDSAEVPMNVAVKVVVTDLAGKVTHQNELSTSMVFRGYSLGTGKFSIVSTKNGLTPFGVHDSLPGGLAAFVAATKLFKLGQAKVEIVQPEQNKATVFVRDEKCPAIELLRRDMFMVHPCGNAEFTLTSAPGGDLAMQHVSFDSTGDAVLTKVAHLGEANLKSFHYGVDFQLKTLPGEAKPYLWPLETVVVATTDKGTVTITNQYSAKAGR